MNNNQLDVLLSEALRRFEDGTYMINEDWRKDWRWSE